VTANEGVVTLSGHVENFVEKMAAEEAARRVKGVKAVAQEIEVQLPPTIQRSNDEIAAAAIERVAWDVSMPRDHVQVSVDHGWVTLTGEVEWQFQKAAAERNIQSLFGVVGVANQITIKPTVNTANVSDDITHALHRSWFFDPVTISVSAQDGKVHLSGTAHGPHELQLAAATAWLAPGVTDVENDIEIA
jgi:osmotically-inducible protein OsmY